MTLSLKPLYGGVPGENSPPFNSLRQLNIPPPHRGGRQSEYCAPEGGRQWLSLVWGPVAPIPCPVPAEGSLARCAC